jgi:hypothetical protein
MTGITMGRARPAWNGLWLCLLMLALLAPLAGCARPPAVAQKYHCPMIRPT